MVRVRAQTTYTGPFRAPLRFAALFGLALLRFALFGFDYLPLLDDHIQYFNYASLMGGLAEATKRLGLLAARPLAGVLDIALWSKFWPNLFGAQVLLALVFTASALLLEKVLDETVGTSPLFVFLFLLLPVNYEATYWLSAATRVIPGLFLAALAGRCALSCGKRPALIAVSGLCCLLAAGFYEQCFVIAAGMTALCGLAAAQSLLCAALSLILPCAAFAGYTAFCTAMGPSALYGGRAALILPFRDAGYVSLHLPEVSHQLGALGKALAALPMRALRRLPSVLGERHVSVLLLLFLFVLIVPALQRSAACRNAEEEGFSFAKNLHTWGEGNRALLALFIGALLTAASFAPFFVVAGPWIGLRALGAALPGLAIMGDALLRLAGAALRASEGLLRICSGMLAAVMLLAGISELSDYRLTAEQDDALLAAVSAVLPQDAKRVALLNLAPCYLPDQNYEWHEHLHGVTESRWALTGALREKLQRLEVPETTPLAQGQVYPEYADDLPQYDAFYLIEGGGATVPEEISALPLTRVGPLFYDGTGRLRACLDGNALTVYEETLHPANETG